MLSERLIEMGIIGTLTLSCGQETRNLRLSTPNTADFSQADVYKNLVFSEGQIAEYFEKNKNTAKLDEESREFLLYEVKSKVDQNEGISDAQGELLVKIIMGLFDAAENDNYSQVSTAIGALSLYSETRAVSNRETNERLFGLVNSLATNDINDILRMVIDYIEAMFRGEEPSPEPTPEPEPIPLPGPTPEPNPGEPHCLDDDPATYQKAGKYRVSRKTVGRVKMYAPQGVAAGCKVPVLHFSNGTGASCAFYRSTLQNWASHGFIATCYETTQSGSGSACTKAMDAAVSAYPELADATKFGSSGHSQGGGASITCTYLLEQKYGSSATIAGHAVQPAHGMNRRTYKSEYRTIQSPIFMFNGSRDTIVPKSWVGDGYNQLRAETYWYQGQGISHMNPQSHASQSGVAWFRWKLLGDERAKEYFLELPQTSRWSLIKTKNTER